MSKILQSIILLLLTYSSNAQSPDTTNKSAVVPVIKWNGLMAEKEFYPPFHDTNYIPIRPGAIVKRPQDSLNGMLYTWAGNVWKALTSGADLASIDSLIALKSGSGNLQSITNGGTKTSNVIWSKGLIIGDTSQMINTSNSGGIAGGNIRYDGLIRADSIASFAFGSVDSGAVRASGRASIAQGSTSCSQCLIQATSWGAFARGRATTNTPASQRMIPSQIIASSDGAFATGVVYNATMKATAGGATAMGGGQGGGLLLASGYGSLAHGYISGGGVMQDTIEAKGAGATVHGYLSNGSTVAGLAGSSIRASGNGAFVSGQISGPLATLTASGGASFASGYVGGNNNQGTGKIMASGSGSFAQGLVGSYGEVSATGNGSFAHGRTQQSGVITSTSDGASANGYATSSGAIKSQAYGSFATGSAYPNGILLSNGQGSFVGGYTSGGTMNAAGSGSFVYGVALGGGLMQAINNGAIVLGTVGTASDSLYNSGAGSIIVGNQLINSGTFSGLFGYGIRNASDYVYKIGFGKDFFAVNGAAGNITISVPETTNSDIEITDSSKGVIFKTPTGERVRMTMSMVNGVPTPVYAVL